MKNLMREVQRMTTHSFIRNSVYQFSQFYQFTNLANLVNLVKRLLFSQFFGFLGNSYRYLRIYLLKAPFSPHAKKNLISSIVNFVYELPHVLPNN